MIPGRENMKHTCLYGFFRSRAPETAKNMKINQKVNVDIKGEGEPRIPHPDDEGWSGISLPWMAFGYGVSMTPLQTLTFYNAVANNGEMVKPSFISSIGAFGEDPVYTINREVIMPSICSNETLISVQKMLNNVVSKPWGTANNIYDENIRIAGKTGTTNEAESTWFTGYNENIVTSVWVGFDTPKSLGDREFGSTIALPIWLDYKKEIIDEIPVSIELPPEGLTVVKIDKESGKLASKETTRPAFEYFLEENIPN